MRMTTIDEERDLWWVCMTTWVSISSVSPYKATQYNVMLIHPMKPMQQNARRQRESKRDREREVTKECEMWWKRERWGARRGMYSRETQTSVIMRHAAIHAKTAHSLLLYEDSAQNEDLIRLFSKCQRFFSTMQLDISQVILWFILF